MRIVNELNFDIEQTESGLSAFCNEIDVYTIGEDMKELRENVRRAINIYYENASKSHGDEIKVSFRRLDNGRNTDQS